MTEDRLTRGFIAGLVGGLTMNILNLLSVYVFHFAKCLYLDWAAAMLFGNKASKLAQIIIALIGQAVFTGFKNRLCLFSASGYQ